MQKGRESDRAGVRFTSYLFPPVCGFTEHTEGVISVDNSRGQCRPDEPDVSICLTEKQPITVKLLSTHTELCDNNIHNAADHDQSIKGVPGVHKVMLQETTIIIIIILTIIIMTVIIINIISAVCCSSSP